MSVWDGSVDQRRGLGGEEVTVLGPAVESPDGLLQRSSG